MIWLGTRLLPWWLGFLGCQYVPEIADLRRARGWGYWQLGAQMILAWTGCESEALAPPPRGSVDRDRGRRGRGLDAQRL